MKRAISLFLALTLAVSLAVPASAAEEGYSDVGSHYAKGAVETWSGYGVLQGYPDGTFRPDEPVTRAEMATVLDRVMGYQNTVENTFTDVPGNAWYAQSILHLAAEGIFQGRKEGQMLPKANITRQEAFAALARAMGMEAGEEAPGFTDDADIAKWAVGSLAAMKEAGYIKGDKKGNIRPDDPITRAEVVTVLNNMAAAFVHEDGEYSADCAGNLIINAQDVHLKDMTIEGDLIVADGVGEGDVYLEKVTVKGDIILRGCGENSFHILPGCVVGNVIVTKTTKGMIRLTNESGKTIPVVRVNDGSDGVILDGDALGDVVVVCDAPVTIRAKSVKTLSVTGNAELTVSKDTTVSSLELTETAKEAKVAVEGKVTELINDADVKIDNKGTIGSSGGSSSGGSSSSGSGGSSSGGSTPSQPTTISEVKLQLLAPTFAAIPDEADPLGKGFTAKTAWTNADGTPATYRWKAADSTEKDTFTAEQAYQAMVTLTPASRYTFAEELKVTVTDGRDPATEYTPVKSEKSGSNWVVTLTYEKTDAKEFVEEVGISGPTAIGLDETGELTVGYQDNYLVDPAVHTYQWYKCDDAAGNGKTVIARATAKTYKIPTVDSFSVGKLYYCCDVTVQGKTYPSSVIKVEVEDTFDESKVIKPVLPEKLNLIDNKPAREFGIRESGRVTGLLNNRGLSYQISVYYGMTITKMDGMVKEISVEMQKDPETNQDLRHSGSLRVKETDESGYWYGDYESDHHLLGNTFAALFSDLPANAAVKDVTITAIKLIITPYYYDIATSEIKYFNECIAEKVYDISETPITYHFVRSTDDMEQWDQVAKAAYPCSDEQYIYHVRKDDDNPYGWQDAYRVQLSHTDGGPVTAPEIASENLSIIVTGRTQSAIYGVELKNNGDGSWAGLTVCHEIENLEYFTGYLEYRPALEKDGQPVFEYYYYSIDPQQKAGLSIENM